MVFARMEFGAFWTPLLVPFCWVFVLLTFMSFEVLQIRLILGRRYKTAAHAGVRLQESSYGTFRSIWPQSFGYLQFWRNFAWTQRNGIGQRKRSRQILSLLLQYRQISDHFPRHQFLPHLWSGLRHVSASVARCTHLHRFQVSAPHIAPLIPTSVVLGDLRFAFLWTVQFWFS